MQHIYSGSGAPNFTPQGVGHHYIDIENKDSYIACGKDSPLDWKKTSVPDVATNTTLEIFELTPQDISRGYIELSFVALQNSIQAAVNRLNLYVGEDLDTSIVSSKTRLTFAGSVAHGGEEALEPGDTLRIRYIQA